MADMTPRYSIILPTLNGTRTLSLTLPYMLAHTPQNVEWVISENHSDDGTWTLLQDIAGNHSQVKLVQPPTRLPIGKHLEFAYTHATGEWLSHIGDDDLLLPWRFTLLDAVLQNLSPNCRLIRGDYVRYNWPEYPEPQFANSLDAALFTNKQHLQSGNAFAQQLLQQPHIHGGGAWVVHCTLVEKVRKKCGWFASPQHVEFFAMRAAACLSLEVMTLHSPLFILGRHGKSSGTQYFLPRITNVEKTWDWSFEDPERYAFSPFNWKSYNTLSLDAALAVQAAFPEVLGKVDIQWKTWLRAIHSETMRLIAFGQLPQSARDDFLRAVAKIPHQSQWYWRFRTWRLRFQHWLQGEAKINVPASGTVSRQQQQFSWPALAGNAVGFENITQLADWLQHKIV
jgi:glycosyltransferase involved in cell wall biosynthesis